MGRGKNRNKKQDNEGVWKDRLRSQMQQPPEFPQIVQQHPAGPQVQQQHMQQLSRAGPLNVPQQPTEPQSTQQQSPAAPLNVPQQPTGPQALQPLCRAGPQAMQLQRPTCPQAMQQQRPAGPSYTPEEVIELQRIHRNNPMLLFTLLLRQPAPNQQAIESREMAQRPVAPQQCPTVSQTQQSRAVAPAAIRTQSTANQASHLVGALRPPSRKTAGGEETLGHPILLSTNNFDETMQLKRLAGPQAMELQHPTGPQEINLSTNYSRHRKKEQPATQGVWKDRLRTQVQQCQAGLQVVQQRPAGPQVVQQRQAGPQVVQQRPAGPQLVQQHPAAPQAEQVTTSQSYPFLDAKKVEDASTVVKAQITELETTKKEEPRGTIHG